MSGKVKLAFMISGLIGIAALWMFTPLKQYLDPAFVADYAQKLPENLWVVASFLGVFAAGGVLMIPMPLLSFAVSLVFPLWQSVIICILGSALASSSGYLLGYASNILEKLGSLQKYVDKARDAMTGKGAWSVVAFRVAPTPPFTVTSILSGSIGISFGRYLLGSVLGIFPFMLLTQVFGMQMLKQLKNPSTLGLSALIAIVLLFAVFKFVVNKNHNSEPVSES